MLTDKQIKQILIMILESKCGKDFINRFKIKLHTTRCSSINRKIRCRHVYHIYCGYNQLEEYRANRTLDNARRVINSYANGIIDKFNKWQDKLSHFLSKKPRSHPRLLLFTFWPLPISQTFFYNSFSLPVLQQFWNL